MGDRINEIEEISHKLVVKLLEVAESDQKKLRYVKIHPNAYPPRKAAPKAVGFDLSSLTDNMVPARGKQIINTGLKIILPQQCYGRIAPRSGLAVKHFIDVGAGVIDADYEGEILVVLFNHSSENFEIKSGDRIAQLICEKVIYPDLEELSTFPPNTAIIQDNVVATARGEDGFGSTGR